MYKLGIDFGGTKIEGIILDESGKEFFRKRIDTEKEKGYERIIYNIKSLYLKMIDKINKAPHTLGIGTPGAISAKTGLLKNSNTVCCNNKPIKEDIEVAIGRKVVIENDANCFAMAEALYGAGQGKSLVFGVIMGTGCGGGIVYKGEVLRGHQAIGGEWGHMSIDSAGPPCYCGQNGCVETFISGGGLEKQYKIKYGDKKTLIEIVNDYRNNEKNSIEFMTNFFKNFGRSLANLINILDPDIVVLGGGVSNINELYTIGVKQVEHFIFSDCLLTPIVKYKLGDSAGVLGAALIGV